MSLKFKLTALCLAGSLALVGCGNNEEEQKQPEKTAAASQQAKESKVPKVEGKTLYEAIGAIREANLTYAVGNKDFDVEKERHKTREWIVEKQDKKAGETVPLKETVTLTLKKK